MPVIAGKRRHLDAPTLVAILEEWRPDLVVVEQVHAMRDQGVASVFSFGFMAGCIEGAVTALGIALEKVTPQGWKKAILSGTAKDKQAAIDYCRRRWPATSLLATPRCRTPHDGIADALVLAEFGRRLLAS
jgi:crossover junction endodeoxyribonuclease RuvC